MQVSYIQPHGNNSIHVITKCKKSYIDHVCTLKFNNLISVSYKPLKSVSPEIIALSPNQVTSAPPYGSLSTQKQLLEWPEILRPWPLQG